MIFSVNDPRRVCFDAQQSIEKAIKAALISENIKPQYIHNLVLLLDDLPSGWDIKNMRSDISIISRYAVKGRYPDMGYTINSADAQNAMNVARKVYDSVQTELKSRGVI